MTTYKPGSFFLTSISGPTGFIIGLGQALCGDGSRYQHAGLILDESGTILEAEPGGARISHLSEYAGRPLLISDWPVQRELARFDAEKIHWNGTRDDLEKFLREDIVREAHNVIGLGYSPLDYVALALLHLHLPSLWVRRRVQRSGRMICSQLVDAVYERANIHLFDDGRLSGDVMPADLAAWAEDWTATS